MKKNQEMEMVYNAINTANKEIANKIANQIKNAKNGKQVKLGMHTLNDSEKLYYVQLHDRFAELEKAQNPMGEINNEAQYQQYLQQGNPVFTGILATVVANRSWLNFKNKDLLKTYSDLYRDLHYGVLDAWDNRKLDDEYFQTYFGIVD